MPSRRLERISRLLQQAVSEVILNELRDPRMGFITVTRVEPAPDLKTAKVFVSVLGEEAVIRRTMQGLEHAAGFIKRTVGDLVTLRITPALLFVRDDSVKRSVRISRILSEVVRKETPAEPPVQDEPGPVGDEGDEPEESDEP